jgi:DNA-binding transcriptional regulator GbsR (MarR family)
MSDCLSDVKEKLVVLWERLAQARGFDLLLGRILAHLYMSEEPLSQKELSEKTDFSVPAISKTLDQLVALGGVKKFKKKGERTYYYSASATPQQMLIAGLSKWVDDQKIMHRELSILKSKLETETLTENEKNEAEKLIATIEDFEKTFDEVEKTFEMIKEKLIKT